MVVSRGEREVVGKIGEGCQDAQTSTYAINNSWAYNVQRGIYSL